MAEYELRARPLEHEGEQVGYVITCPNCGTDIVVPIGEFLDGEHHWQIPPQNSGIAPAGWHFAWGTQDDPSHLHLRQSMAIPHGDHGPGADDQIVCSRREWTPTGDIANIGCGHAYTVVRGKLIEVG